ncbi:tail fiber protein [Pontibacter amylolyticus]|uniref:Peptidase S74 domain-containing protein n=1 Tax=Pontibacter amylolyticus TaxID=1424080 RepID=A0ABQ1W8G3_9BACT|nr:tail fiber protein [Pontibacter amylolyticus]GGG18977.1 hypothetical protein GCM10011323_23900 [Pontibacter amylolyticus]
MFFICLLSLLCTEGHAQWQSSGGDIFYNSGRVGVGITPLNGLHLHKLDNLNGGSFRLGHSGSFDAVLSYGWDGISQDAFKITRYNHNSYNGATDLMTIQTSGNVGIGTNNPNQKLHVAGNMVLESDVYGSLIFTGTGQGEFNRYLRLINSPQQSSAAGLKAGGVLIADSYNYADPDKNDLIVKGNVGIGTATPDAKLTVAGNVHAREVKVTVAAGADFVFEEDYKLPSLEDTEKFVRVHKHLPGIAPAAEMEQEGLDLGKMNILLLQKVEELTLHLIRMDEEIKALRKNNH